MDFGDALYRAVSGRSPETEPRSMTAALAVFVRHAGSVAGAARLAGVPRRTMRDWLSGKHSPRGDRRNVVIQAAVKVERRGRLRPGRERRLRAGGEGNVHIAGRYRYDEHGRGSVDLGRYLQAGAIDAVIDAYLDGADGDQLGDVLADHIADPAQFYARTLRSDDPQGWEIHRVNLEGDTR